MSTRVYSEWNPTRTGLPDGDRIAQFRFLLRFAILAPSGHNVQPWRFEIDRESESLLIKLEWSRVLRVSDPHDRLTFMSLGTTARNLVRAAEGFGLAADAQIVGEGDQAHVRVQLGDAPRDLAQPIDWIDAITRRITNRSSYYREELSEPLRNRLTDFEIDGVDINTYTTIDEKQTLADLTSTSSRKLINSKDFRFELAQYFHPNSTTSRIGMPAASQGVPGLLSPLAPHIVRHARVGTLFSIRDRRQLSRAPLIVVLATADDSTTSWISAGMAHEELFLRVTSERLALDTFAAATCDDHARAELARRMGLDGYPQILVRIGRAKKNNPARTPRLSVADVLTET